MSPLRHPRNHLSVTSVTATWLDVHDWETEKRFCTVQEGPTGSVTLRYYRDDTFPPHVVSGDLGSVEWREKVTDELAHFCEGACDNCPYSYEGFKPCAQALTREWLCRVASLWHQRSYLASLCTLSEPDGWREDDIADALKRRDRR
jgi:hypothetical protein